MISNGCFLREIILQWASNNQNKLRFPSPRRYIAKMVWPCLKVFWFSKDNPTGHSERKKKKRQSEEEVGKQYQRVDRNGLCQLY